MKKTFEQLMEVDQLVGELFKKDPVLKDSKFGYAYKRFLQKNYEKPYNDFQHELKDTQIDHALAHEITHEILLDPMNSRGYKYTKEGLKAVLDSERDILERWNKMEFEIQPFISSYVPEMTEDQKEMLTGLVL